MINAYPEENIVFKFHHKILLTPHEISKISIYSNSSSLSNSIIIEHIEDINKTIDKKIEKESINNKIENYNVFENKKYISNIPDLNNKNIFIDKKVNNNSSISNIIKQKLFLFKWI
jgi:hypothetical protein